MMFLLKSPLSQQFNNVSVKGDGNRRYPNNLSSLDMSTSYGDESCHYSSNLIMFLLKVMEVAIIPRLSD